MGACVPTVAVHAGSWCLSLCCFLFVMEVIWLICYVTVLYCPWRSHYIGENECFILFFTFFIWREKNNIFRNVLLHLCEHVNYTVLGFYYNIPALFFYNKPLPMALLLQLACCERWSCHAWFALSLLRLLLTQEVSSHLKHHCVFFLHAGVNVNEVQVTQQGRLIWSVQYSSVHVRVTFGALSNWTRFIFNIQVWSFLIFRTLLPFYIMI